MKLGLGWKCQASSVATPPALGAIQGMPLTVGIVSPSGG